jgi:hypothetical protein
MPDSEIDNRIRRLLTQAKFKTPKTTSKRCISLSILALFFTLFAAIILLFQTITVSVRPVYVQEKTTVYYKVKDTPVVEPTGYGINIDIKFVGCVHFNHRTIQPVEMPIESAI